MMRYVLLCLGCQKRLGRKYFHVETFSVEGFGRYFKRKEVELEKNKVRDEMKQEMVQVASAMAGKFVEASMNKDKQAQLIDETLKEMGDETWQS